MITVKYLSKDNDWQDGSTTYWFELTGTEYGVSGFAGGVFGVVESGDYDAVFVDADNYPIADSGSDAIVAKKYCIVTDAMRLDF